MEKGYNSENNYCSFSPDEIFGVRFNYACYLHDRQYRNEVKKRKNRLQSDNQLRDKMYEIIKNSNDPFKLRIRIKKLNINKTLFTSKNKLLIKLRKKLAYPLSRIYYYSVRMFARKHWTK